MSIDNPKYVLVELHPQAEANDFVDELLTGNSQILPRMVNETVHADDDGFGRIVLYPTTRIRYD